MWKSKIQKLKDLSSNKHCKTNLEKTLQPIKHLDIPSDSESDSSGIQDIFEEFHRESFLRPIPGTKSKFYTKYESDKMTVDKFTDDFKRVMKETREELKVGDALMAEDEKDIEKILCSQTVKVFLSKLQAASQDKISPKAQSPEIPREDSPESMISNIWDILRANSSAEFIVSPPGFEYIRKEDGHWLERPPVPWEVVNEANIKVGRWLTEQMQ